MSVHCTIYSIHYTIFMLLYVPESCMIKVNITQVLTAVFLCKRDNVYNVDLKELDGHSIKEDVDEIINGMTFLTLLNRVIRIF